jgi:hypothetical protein
MAKRVEMAQVVPSVLQTQSVSVMLLVAKDRIGKLPKEKKSRIGGPVVLKYYNYLRVGILILPDSTFLRLSKRWVGDTPPDYRINSHSRSLLRHGYSCFFE